MVNQRRNSGLEPPVGLRSPPGFENLAAISTDEQDSSTLSPSASGATHGIFPFPPACDSPRSPSPSTPSSPSQVSFACSTRPEVSSEFSNRGKMSSINAWFVGHHHNQMVAIMHKKFQDLLDYDKTKNQKILHVDWVAGNPNDPIKKEGGSAAHGGMSEEDRRLSESVARSVMRITHGVNQWDETETWNKALFYGDWVKDPNGFRQFFLEIQVKRVSGADDLLQQKCGIHPEHAWLSLHDEEAQEIRPMVFPALAPRALPVPGQVAREAIPEVEEREFAAPAPASLQVPTSSADKGKGKAVAPPQAQASGTNPAAPVIVSSESAQSPQMQTQLPSIGDLALGQQASADVPVPSIEGNVTRAGIPRSQPLPPSDSFDSIEAPQSEVSNITETTTESREDDTVQVQVVSTSDANTTSDNRFENLAPAHQTPAASAADLHWHRVEFDRNAMTKYEELQRIFTFTREPAFIERKNKSFIYAVRVVAIPYRSSGTVVNDFTGPRLDDRHATILGQGGWVVPPLEERIQWRDEHKRAYRNKGAKLGKYGGLPRGQVQNAMPVKFDWSGVADPRYYGVPAPLWRELCDPCLEDIYWMVWQMLAGKVFVGFRGGNGFGLQRRGSAGQPSLLQQCPFKSPSTEALYHAASYPRGKEQ